MGQRSRHGVLVALSLLLALLSPVARADAPTGPSRVTAQALTSG